MSDIGRLPEFDLSSRVALITGGYGGLGRAMALGLSRAGADVAIVERDGAKAEAHAREISAAGGRAIGIACDVSSKDDLLRAVDATVAHLGKLSILVNNAAVNLAGKPLSDEDFDGQMAVNLKGPFMLCKAAYPALKADGGGKVINIASGAAIVSWVPNPTYGMTKAGLVHLTRTLAVSWARDNIQVSCILPGAFPTGMNNITPESEAAWVEHTPAARVGDPAEIAGIAIFLASRASDYMTGQCIAFDGGVTIPRVARLN